MIEKFGGRKVIFGLFLIAVGVTIESVYGLSETMMQFIVTIGLGFFLGNGIEHSAVAISKRKEAPPAPIIQNDNKELKADLDIVKSQSIELVKTTQLIGETLNYLINVTGLSNKRK